MSVFVLISTCTAFSYAWAALFKMQPWDSKSKLNQEINKVTVITLDSMDHQVLNM